MNDAEKKVAESLGLTPEGLEALRRRLAAERQLSTRELAVCEAIHMSPEVYLRNKIREAGPEMSPEELRAEQARVMRMMAPAAPEADRARMLAKADALEAGEDPNDQNS